MWSYVLFWQTPAFDDETGMQHLVRTDESDTTDTVMTEDEDTLNSSVRVNDKEEEEDLGKVTSLHNLQRCPPSGSHSPASSLIASLFLPPETHQPTTRHP